MHLSPFPESNKEKHWNIKWMTSISALLDSHLVSGIAIALSWCVQLCLQLAHSLFQWHKQFPNSWPYSDFPIDWDCNNLPRSPSWLFSVDCCLLADLGTGKCHLQIKTPNAAGWSWGGVPPHAAGPPRCPKGCGNCQDRQECPRDVPKHRSPSWAPALPSQIRLHPEVLSGGCTRMWTQLASCSRPGWQSLVHSRSPDRYRRPPAGPWLLGATHSGNVARRLVGRWTALPGLKFWELHEEMMPACRPVGLPTRPPLLCWFAHCSIAAHPNRVALRAHTTLEALELLSPDPWLGCLHLAVRWMYRTCRPTKSSKASANQGLRDRFSSCSLPLRRPGPQVCDATARRWGKHRVASVVGPVILSMLGHCCALW